ncbi:MAG: phosphate regulon sensor histidine kinase PhoR [Pseudomonadales bacterium]|nr:phosphate regulon sensor histidine kinase PhoR [Pseudomonadales bacterium]
MYTWRGEFKRYLLIFAVVGIVSYFFGVLLPSLLILTLILLGIDLLQLHRLQKWLAIDHASDKSAPPESFGVWGGVFDGIYRLQKQERRASAHLESLLNKAQESSAALEMGIVMINRHNNLDWWNRASESLLGLRHPQDRGQSITNLIRDPQFHEYFHSENYDDPLKLNAPGDSTQILEYQIATFGKHERLMIVRDITQLHRLESMRKDFVGNVSHELGTPITVIKGYLEAIIDNMQDLDPKWQKPIQQMHQQSTRMENIVRDLLLLSSLETKHRPKPQDSFSLSSLLSEIRNDTLQIYKKKSHNFTLECDASLELLGDRGELYSALSNLVVNAAKYTPANGTISVRVEHDEESLTIEVEDNGIGIDVQHLPRLTERFYRVDVSRSSETGGTGLGLAIVKHILMRHDGELNIESEIGEGSCFVCRFPQTRFRQSEPAVESIPQESSADTTTESPSTTH